MKHLNVKKLIIFEMATLLTGLFTGQALSILINKTTNAFMLASMFAETIGVMISVEELKIFTKKEN